MKEQQKRKIHQFHTEIEDGIDLRRYPPKSSIKSHISNTLAKNNASWVSSLILSYSFLISSYTTRSSNMWFSEAEAWSLFAKSLATARQHFNSFMNTCLWRSDSLLMKAAFPETNFWISVDLDQKRNSRINCAFETFMNRSPPKRRGRMG